MLRTRLAITAPPVPATAPSAAAEPADSTQLQTPGSARSTSPSRAPSPADHLPPQLSPPDAQPQASASADQTPGIPSYSPFSAEPQSLRDLANLIRGANLRTEESLDAMKRENQKNTDKLDARMERLEWRLLSLEGRVDAVGDRVGAVEGRMGAVEGRMGAVEGRMGAVEERMGSVEGRMGLLESRMTRQEESIAKVNNGIVSLGRKVDDIGKDLDATTLELGQALEQVRADLNSFGVRAIEAFDTAVKLQGVMAKIKEDMKDREDGSSDIEGSAKQALSDINSSLDSLTESLASLEADVDNRFQYIQGCQTRAAGVARLIHQNQAYTRLGLNIRPVPGKNGQYPPSDILAKLESLSSISSLTGEEIDEVYAIYGFGDYLDQPENLHERQVMLFHLLGGYPKQEY
ncbi:hypothetical protein IAT38_005681 [Cryptococcus sp. DSM 104549]